MVREWEAALDSDSVDHELLEQLSLTRVRDIVIASASSDEPGNYARALSGAEAMGNVPKGTSALAGRLATPQDALWLQDIYVGEGVVPGKRLRRLEAATADHEGLDPEAASGAATVNGWARWQLGDIAGARGTLAAELDENPDNKMAGLLLKVIDMQRRNRDGPRPQRR